MATKFITPNGDKAAILRNFNPQPGDILVMESKHNPWSYVDFSNIQGTIDKPIILINQGGQVLFTAGIGFGGVGSTTTTRFVKCLGNGDPAVKYGFKVSGNSGGAGISIGGLASDIEIGFFSIHNCAYGVWNKNEADCDIAVNAHVLNNISFHDYEIMNVASQGFYMGSTDPNNFDRPINCGGVTKNYAPSRLGNIKVYNGIIDGTGRPGIQLSGASVGVSEIYNNKIRNTGRQFDDAQGSGISLGGYTKAHVHDNDISDTYTWGIVGLGAVYAKIENNTVNNSGKLDGKSLAWPANIHIDTRSTIPEELTTFVIQNNKLTNHGGDPGTANITVSDQKKTLAKTGNVISGNTGTVKVETGVIYDKGIVTPPPTAFLSAAKSQSFTKNDCATGTGSDVVYAVPAGKYTSTISQADADLKATNDVIVNGQGFANANGICTQPVKTVFRKGYFVISSKRYYYIMYTDGTWENKR